MHLLILLLALLIDRVVGDPDWLWKRVRHPVAVFGGAVAMAEGWLNRAEKSPYEKRRDGFVAIAGLLVLAAFAGLAVVWLCSLFGPIEFLIQAAVASIFLAQKSLIDHVSAVSTALATGGLDGGRRAVSMIVGRDPNSLDESAVCRAAIESLAENSSDGVIAPAFWFVVAGLPGLFAYKMLNTADSMIGHMNERYRDFGRASAKLDDAANWIPARLTGLLLIAAGALVVGSARAKQAFGGMMRDARLHRSPNAGWPESAIAGLTGLALAGPRIYNGDIANEPMLNAGGRRAAGVVDIDASIAIVAVMFTLFAALVGLIALL